MTQAGWIIVAVIAIVAIILVAMMLRKKPIGNLPMETVADDLLPEQVTPEPVAAPEPVKAPPPAPAPPQPPAPSPIPVPPQTIAAEETPPPVAPAPVQQAISPAPVEEPVAASPVPAPAPAPAPVGDDDNLLKLKGVGPKIATLLKTEGVTRFAQIAAWSEADIAAVDAKLGSFAGRPKRDNWVDQARFLAAGDTAGYEAKYGKL